jgi:hypothetical protein
MMMQVIKQHLVYQIIQKKNNPKIEKLQLGHMYASIKRDNKFNKFNFIFYHDLLSTHKLL